MVSTARIHGGPDAQGAAAHDFSTNANACGPCPQALAAVQAADASRYPDPAYTGLRAVLARHHAVESRRIVLAGSASEFIFRISGWARRHGAARVGLPAHGYGDYGAAAAAWGLQPSAAQQADLLWACEPSSPLGAAAGLEPLPTGPHTVVLDRAYEPLRLHGSCSLPADTLARCWQLWSPNKALGLTGVRGAYAIAPAGAQAVATQLEALAPSWLLGTHGVALLQAWCEPAVQQWLAHSLTTLRAWKQRQAAVCEALGWTVLPSVANFFTCRTPLDLGQLAQLRAQGIALRDCSSFGLPGHLRLGVLPPASQDALRQAVEAFR